MKKIFLGLIMVSFGIPSIAQINFPGTLKKAKDTYNKTTKSTGTKSLSNDEIIGGLKEALNVGTQNSTNLASKLDGFYKNPKIKIPFPPEAEVMQSKLRSIGMGNQVDKFVVALNRAAEDAAKSAAPVFISSIKSMSITDGLGILNGGNDAATNYLRSSTSAELKNKFKPLIEQSLQKVSITQYWTPLVTAYNRIPMVEKKNPDLNDYVTQRAMDGLFYLVSQEELKIRKDPAARVNDILKKVFGGK